MVHEEQLKRDALPHQKVSVEIAIPVYNEETILPLSVATLTDYLSTYFPYQWSVTIVDNASKDNTLAVAQELADHPNVRVLALNRKGKGGAIHAAWSSSDADVVAYMDVDLSTSLESFLPLVAPLVSGHSDLSIGSRLHNGAVVRRQWKREVTSRCYNMLIKLLLFRNSFSDAQCGFKAVKGSVAQSLLPEVEDRGWFFDSEVLLLAEERGLRIHEIPVDWTEDVDSRVRVASTAMENVRGLLRMRYQRLHRSFKRRRFALNTE